MKDIHVKIHTPFIKLDQLLKYAELTSSGGESSIWIRDGKISIDGIIVCERGKKIRPGMKVVCSLSEKEAVTIIIDETK